MPAPVLPAKDPSGVRKILIVEDDPIIANLIQVFLSKKQYKICGKAETGESAIALAAQEQPDLVLMDINLKGELDGVFAAKYIFNAFNIPVIFLTGNSDDDTIQRAAKAEPFGFITKPFGDTDLYSSIEIGLHNHEIRNRVLKVGPPPIRKILDMLDAVLLVDITGRIFFMNSYAEILLGMRTSDVVPKYLSQVMTVLDVKTGEEYLDFISDVIKESMLVGMEKHVIIETLAGDKKDVILMARPLRDPVDEIIGAVLRIHRKSHAEKWMSRNAR